MHDIRAIRDNPAQFDAALARRGLSGLSQEILALDEARRVKILAAEKAQSEQRRRSRELSVIYSRLRTQLSQKSTSRLCLSLTYWA